VRPVRPMSRLSEKTTAIQRLHRFLMRGFDYAPDTLIGAANESSRDNGSAFIAAIVLKCERTVALGNTNQGKAFLPKDINGPAIDVGASIANFHGAS
jgi:hypothetical protein